VYETLLPLLLILAGFYLAAHSMRAREAARGLAHELCARHGLQLLDQTVALRRLRVRRVPGTGLRLLRCYRFDVSTDGHDRQHGSLDLIDGEIASYDLPASASDSAPARSSGNVIELRPTRTVH
jgi:hypothetical protein